MRNTFVDFWDLDGTLLDATQLFLEVIGEDYDSIRPKLLEAGKATFTLRNYLAVSGVLRDEHTAREAAYLADIKARANGCLYPGVEHVLEERSKVARQVLVTAGDPTWQQQKFDAATKLHKFFLPEDRHFVPLNNSKGEILLQYSGTRTFIDDSPERLQEALDTVPGTKLIRPIFAHAKHAAHPGDGILWSVVRSADEILTQLS